MAVTLRDVAERAGVSRSAVSRAFTDGASVSPAMRERVMKAAGELGYTPNIIASGLSTGRTKLIGLISNNFSNPFYLQVFDHFTRAIQTRDLRPLLVNLTDETDPAASLRMLRQYSVDGVVVASSTLPPEFSAAFADAGLPVVHAFARHLRRPDVDTVGVDNVEVGRLAARELHERGYRRIAFLGGPETATSTIDRRLGFMEMVRALPDLHATIHHAGNYSFDAGLSAMQALLQAGPPAEAYFCGDDVISVGAIAALERSGLAIPDDVGILGVNDMEVAGWANIALTTIRQPVGAIVDAVIERLIARIANPGDIPRAIALQAKLVERATLRPRPVA